MQQWHLVLSPVEEARSDKQKGLLHVNMMLGKTGHGVQTDFILGCLHSALQAVSARVRKNSFQFSGHM